MSALNFFANNLYFICVIYFWYGLTVNLIIVNLQFFSMKLNGSVHIVSSVVSAVLLCFKRTILEWNFFELQMGLTDFFSCIKKMKILIHPISDSWQFLLVLLIWLQHNNWQNYCWMSSIFNHLDKSSDSINCFYQIILMFEPKID